MTARGEGADEKIHKNAIVVVQTFLNVLSNNQRYTADLLFCSSRSRVSRTDRVYTHAGVSY